MNDAKFPVLRPSRDVLEAIDAHSEDGVDTGLPASDERCRRQMRKMLESCVRAGLLPAHLLSP